MAARDAGPGLLAALALAAGAAACDAQVPPGYPGEPLLTLRGRVEGTPPVSPVEAAMLWQRGPPPSTSDRELATRAPVEAGFPADFTLTLYQPPPPAARRTLREGEVTFARGNAAAIPFGIAPASLNDLPCGATAPTGPIPDGGATSGPFGMDVDHWVIHLAADVPAGSLTEWWLGAALPAGYHLVEVTSLDPASLGIEALDACAAELAARGVRDDGTTAPGTARSFCLAPYRLAPAPEDAVVVLRLGTYAPAVPGACP